MDFYKTLGCHPQVRQLFCDYLDLFLIWNGRPQNLSLLSRQSSCMKKVPPESKGYQTQRCIRQPGLPSLVTFTLTFILMEGLRVMGRRAGSGLLPKPGKFKSRLTDQKESKLKVSDCSSPTMKVLSHKQEVRYFLGYYWVISNALVWTFISLTKENKK